MEFKNKKILVVCKETYSYPFFHLCQKWVNDNEVAAFFFNPVETKYNKCLLNDTTYYAFIEKLSAVKIYNSDEIADEFTKILYCKEVIDKAYLETIESKYTHFKGINQQIVSTQFLTSHYHYRNFMHSTTYIQQLNWLLLNYKNVEKILDDFQPDVVLDCDYAELSRVILSEICFNRGIPYISIDFPRYEDYIMASYSLSYKCNNIFVELFNKNSNLEEAGLSEEMDYVTKFANKDAIMQKIYKNDVTSQYKPEPIIKSFINWLYQIRYFVNQDIEAKNYVLKKSNPILYPNPFQFIKFFARVRINKQILLRKNKYFKAPVEGDKYVYMPLHLIPESSTFSLAPNYINELTIIEAVSKNLPAGWWLYVKEHQAMVGERGKEFYNMVNRLPNVKMMQLNYYQDPKSWILKSKGVVTISGTTAFEAAMLGKHSIVFSDVPFSLIDGIKRETSFENLNEDFGDFEKPLDNIKSCAAYIKTVKELGLPINLKHVMTQTQYWFRGMAELDDKLYSSVNNLEKLFEMYYKLYVDEKHLSKA